MKQLRSIRPDREYSLNSRLAIMESGSPKRVSPWGILVNSFQFSSAVALAAVLLVVVLGGFSAFQFLSPFRLAGIDAKSIRAEADAVDAQLELTSITYAAEPAPELSPEAQTRAADIGIPTSSAETSIEDALDILAE